MVTMLLQTKWYHKGISLTILLLTITSITYAAGPYTGSEGMELLWHLDETANPLAATDSSGHNHTGIVEGNVKGGATGILAKATMNFQSAYRNFVKHQDNVTGYGAVHTSISGGFVNDNWTFGCWVRSPNLLDNVSTLIAQLGQTTPSGPAWELRINDADGSVSFVQSSPSPLPTKVFTSGPLSWKGGWYYLSVRCKAPGTGAPTDVRLDVRRGPLGATSLQTVLSKTFADLNDNFIYHETGSLLVGGGPASGYEPAYYPGGYLGEGSAIDEVVLWTSYRTDAQLQANLVIGLNVKSPTYHAVGDGIADDTAPFQNAINDASSGLGNGVVFVPFGTYKMIDVYLKSNVTILGVPNLTDTSKGKPIIKRPDNTPNVAGSFVDIWTTYRVTPSEKTENVLIDNLEFNGNIANQVISNQINPSTGTTYYDPVTDTIAFNGDYEHNHSLNLSKTSWNTLGCENITVRNCYFNGGLADGISVIRDCKNVQVENIRGRACARGSLDCNGGNSTVKVSDCTIEDFLHIELDVLAPNTTAYFTIQDSRMAQLTCNSLYYPNSGKFYVSGCTIDAAPWCHGAGGLFDNCTFRIFQGSNAGYTRIIASEDLVFTNCRFEGHLTAGTYMGLLAFQPPPNSWTQRLEFNQCVFTNDGAAKAAIGIQDYGYSHGGGGLVVLRDCTGENLDCLVQTFTTLKWVLTGNALDNVNYLARVSQSSNQGPQLFMASRNSLTNSTGYLDITNHVAAYGNLISGNDTLNGARALPAYGRYTDLTTSSAEQSLALVEGLSDFAASALWPERPYAPGQDVNNTLQWPTNLVTGDAVQTGLIIAGVGWDLRLAIASDKAENVLLRTPVLVADNNVANSALNTTWSDARIKALSEDVQLYGGANQQAIADAFDQHGIGNPIPGNCDEDQEVTSSDLSIVLAALYSVPTSGHWDYRADLDDDAIITSGDLSIVMENMDRVGSD